MALTKPSEPITPTRYERSSQSISSILANPRPIVVALYFRVADAPKLWDLAARHWPDSEDISTFAKAARATEKGLPIVLEVTLRQQLEEVRAFFPRHGIEPPTIEELRVS